MHISENKSAIFIDHNIIHVYGAADRFIILDRGEVVHQLNKNSFDLNLNHGAAGVFSAGIHVSVAGHARRTLHRGPAPFFFQDSAVVGGSVGRGRRASGPP